MKNDGTIVGIVIVGTEKPSAKRRHAKKPTVARPRRPESSIPNGAERKMMLRLLTGAILIFHVLAFENISQDLESIEALVLIQGHARRIVRSKAKASAMEMSAEDALADMEGQCRINAKEECGVRAIRRAKSEPLDPVLSAAVADGVQDSLAALSLFQVTRGSFRKADECHGSARDFVASEASIDEVADSAATSLLQQERSKIKVRKAWQMGQARWHRSKYRCSSPISVQARAKIPWRALTRHRRASLCKEKMIRAEKRMSSMLVTRCRSVPAQLDTDGSSDEERGLKAMSFADFAEILPAEAAGSGRSSRRGRFLLLILAVILAFSNEEGRSYLKEGSLYQNDYMTLWNANHVAISVTLKMQDLTHFELRINNLNSKGNGNDGWFAVRGSFELKPLDPEGHFFSIWPDAHGKDTVVVDFDESLQDGATLILYRVMRKLGGSGMMKFLQLKVDATKDQVLVKPQARLLRALWDQPVALRLTTEERLWKPELKEAEEVKSKLDGYLCLGHVEGMRVGWPVQGPYERRPSGKPKTWLPRSF
eukprot:s146_g10.t1